MLASSAAAAAKINYRGVSAWWPAGAPVAQIVATDGVVDLLAMHTSWAPRHEPHLSPRISTTDDRNVIVDDNTSFFFRDRTNYRRFLPLLLSVPLPISDLAAA